MALQEVVIMGAGANSSGNKSLNDRRERAAGRRDDRGPQAEAVKGADQNQEKGATGGAFGSEGQANTKQGNAIGEGGGGGGAATNSDIPDVGTSTKGRHKKS